ncbi:hypothetical protein GCM10010372_61210 [Streptomyces tauricus]|nr:hypothetical protein GCM10010372_61210 [Streptomyces tauricus]
MAGRHGRRDAVAAGRWVLSAQFPAPLKTNDCAVPRVPDGARVRGTAPAAERQTRVPHRGAGNCAVFWVRPYFIVMFRSSGPVGAATMSVMVSGSKEA